MRNIIVLLATLVFAIDGSATQSQSKQWKNWAGTEETLIEALYTPSTEEELIGLVSRARAMGIRLKVLGSGHSLSAIAVPEKGQWAVSLENYARILSIDPQNRTITVQAGTTLAQINEALSEQGLALENLGSTSDQTVGGVFQTGTHATGGNYGPLHTQILSMTVINGKGERKTVTPTTEPQLFRAYQCGLGSLGIVSEVTLRCMPAQRFCENMYEAPWPQMLDQLDILIAENDHFRFYWFPYTDRAGVWTANPTQKTVCAAQKDLTPFHTLIDKIVAEREQNASLSDALLCGPSDPKIIQLFNQAFFEVDYGKPSERVDRSDRIFNADSSAHKSCCAMEVAFPYRYTKEFLLALQELIETNGYPAHTGIEVRFVRADSALISPTYSDDPNDLFCFVSIVTLRPHEFPVEYRPYFTATQTLAEKYGARLHWGKMGQFAPERLKQNYPQWAVFQKLQQEEDPDGLFLNAFTREILRP